MTAQLHGVDELAEAERYVRLAVANGLHRTPPAMLAVLLAEFDRRGAMEQRARSLAATPGLDGAAMTYAHAGRYVLGVA